MPNLTMVDVNNGVSIRWAAIIVLAIQVMNLGLIRRVVKVQLCAAFQCSRDYTVILCDTGSVLGILIRGISL